MSKERSSSRELIVPQRKRTPSFSSTLLDSICRSIDESNGLEKQVMSQYKETTMIKKQSHSAFTTTITGDAALVKEEKEMSNLRRAIMVESWMERQYTRTPSSVHSKSTSSSSDSSYGGGVFSSSEAESNIKENSRRLSSLMPQRTNINKQLQKPKQEGGFTKAKSKALKIYSELKKVKQPISPGRRIASFLNSIFNSGSAKKVIMCSIGAVEDVSIERKSNYKSASSSVTSFSRSCLSNKTPPSRGINKSSGTKRSVRFYPVSVIVDEDSRPCGHKCISEEDPGLMPMPQKVIKSSSLKQDIAKRRADYMRNYQKKDLTQFDLRTFRSGYVEDDCDSSDDDDDDESCSSSDLFELDHLIGIGRYREELPVYETTDLKTNQAIANGFIL